MKAAVSLGWIYWLTCKTKLNLGNFIIIFRCVASHSKSLSLSGTNLKCIIYIRYFNISSKSDILNVLNIYLRDHICISDISIRLIF